MINDFDRNTSLICASIYLAAAMISPDMPGRWGCIALATMWSVLGMAQVLCRSDKKAVK